MTELKNITEDSKPKRNLTDKVFQTIAPTVIMLAVVLLIIPIVLQSKITSRENNAYIRVINCVLSYTANERTTNDIENCYTTIENQLNTRLQRYDNSNKDMNIKQEKIL